MSSTREIEMQTQLRADDGTVLRFANRLYEHAEEPGGYEDALQEIADAFHADALCVHRYGFRRRVGEAVRVLRGISVEDAHEYREHHAPHNIWMQNLPASVQASDVLASHELVPEETLVRHRFYHEFLEPKGLIALLAAVLEAGDAGLTTVNFLRGPNPGSYTDVESQLMRRLAPHLSNAYRVERSFATVRSGRALLTEVIDRISTAVFAVDRDLCVSETNRAAKVLLAAGDGIRISRGTLEVSDCVARDELREAVGSLSATDLGEDASPGGTFPIGRPSLAKPYTATAIPIRSLVPSRSVRRSCCLLFIDDPDQDKPPQLERIQRLWNLTQTEARIASMLATGMSPRQVSDRLGISFNTVRCHVSRIYLKTDTSRQAELVCLLSRLGLTIPESTGADGDGWIPG
jgi:DNA-binding CsgD family transcriptional regulator